jgi:hypothetical protein
MSYRSIKSRFCLPLVGLLLWAAPAIGQGASEITVKLSLAEVSELQRLIDLEAPRTFVSQMPPAYWDLQIAIGRALEADPDAMRAVLSARGASR